MKNWTLKLVAIVLLALGATAFAQVETVNILSVDVTSPTSDGMSAWRADDSVGEVTVRAQAVDADGNPVEGAEVAWTVENSTPQIVWVVASSGPALSMASKPVSDTAMLTLDGGTTNADGIATLTLDSADAADANVYVEIDGVAGDAYRGGELRIVWF
jgi:hypothetical protein